MDDWERPVADTTRTTIHAAMNRAIKFDLGIVSYVSGTDMPNQGWNTDLTSRTLKNRVVDCDVVLDRVDG